MMSIEIKSALLGNDHCINFVVEIYRNNTYDFKITRSTPGTHDDEELFIAEAEFSELEEWYDENFDWLEEESRNTDREEK